MGYKMENKLYEMIEPLDIAKALNSFDDEAIKELNQLFKERGLDLKIVVVE